MNYSLVIVLYFIMALEYMAWRHFGRLKDLVWATRAAKLVLVIGAFLLPPLWLGVLGHIWVFGLLFLVAMILYAADMLISSAEMWLMTVALLIVMLVVLCLVFGVGIFGRDLRLNEQDSFRRMKEMYETKYGHRSLIGIPIQTTMNRTSYVYRLEPAVGNDVVIRVDRNSGEVTFVEEMSHIKFGNAGTNSINCLEKLSVKP